MVVLLRTAVTLTALFYMNLLILASILRYKIPDIYKLPKKQGIPTLPMIPIQITTNNC